MIIGVAIKHGDLVIALPRPNRHYHVIKHMVDVLRIEQPIGHQHEDGQGFYLADGRYLNRRQARQYAIDHKQCLNPSHHRDLFSEDLW